MIKNLLSLPAILVVSLLLPSALLPTPGKASDDTGEVIDLVSAMEDMNAAYRRLTRQIRVKARNADSLLLVAVLRHAAEVSLEFEPEMTRELPEEQRAGFVEGYRRGMHEFLEATGKLESALKADDNAAAARILDRLKDMRSEGHKRYKRAEDA